MYYRYLGNSKLNVSAVSLGCMSLPVSDPTLATSIIHTALDGGINFFDTADLYDKGKNEEILGKSLKHCRKDIIIATKVGNQWKPDGSDWLWNPKKEYILKAVDQSLKRLQTDYIDLYQLHGGTIEDPIDETIEAFELLKEQGKIRYYGISSIRPNVIKTFVAKSNIASVMMQYSLLDRRPEEECLQLLLNHNIGVLTRGTLAKGLLAGKEPSAYLEHTKEEVVKYTDTLRNATVENKPRSHTAIDYVLKHKAISTAVVGASTGIQVEELANYGKLEVIDINQYALLKQHFPQRIYKNFRN
ncbi:aldo/keto reductase [Aquimarina brevivitae]|uniref:Aryl-alcohol dehydrogenase-like predicted oxidoreductase n=1 Tax=Aquimarina brevivitae TaxID=323412 RepID=A0A4Q7PJH9_9FLAO|nr:aldo/keto reductase [Aquimarina brevivitae]RZS99062.1 aryl-alcohol dehydrogenase-like predicted oxidoreductase [Aquimarina brevivitae]